MLALICSTGWMQGQWLIRSSWSHTVSREYRSAVSPMLSNGTAVLRTDNGQWKLTVATVVRPPPPTQDVPTTEA